MIQNCFMCYLGQGVFVHSAQENYACSNTVAMSLEFWSWKYWSGDQNSAEKMVPQTTFSGKIGPTLKILVPPQYGIVVANKLVKNLSIISVQSEHDHDKMQYHVLSLERAVLGTLTQDSVWYHLLQPEHSIQCVFGSSGILRTQYTGTSSTDFTVDSVAHLSLLYGNNDVCLSI